MQSLRQCKIALRQNTAFQASRNMQFKYLSWNVRSVVASGIMIARKL